MDGEGKNRVEALNCRGCGAPLTIRAQEQTEVIACGACGAIMDTASEEYKIISRCKPRPGITIHIPLGARGKIRGDTFEVIGFLRRGITVEGIEYEWSEYLLFNPFKGFRWLSEYNGHWSFIKTTTTIPIKREKKWRSKQPIAEHLGITYDHFQKARARVNYVVGECYWRVSAGETCAVSDYVAPPFILSEEKTDKETTWSLGEYIEAKEIWEGFQLKTPIPPRKGVGPNQPSPYKAGLWSLCGWLVGAACVIFFFVLWFAENKLVSQNSATYDPTSRERSWVTEVFNLEGRTSNVVIKSQASIDNNWLYLNMALVNEETGQAYDFGREISYYHGVDGGESWSEGDRSDKAVLPSIPSGRYYLRVEPESEMRMIGYTVQVWRDVPNVSFFIILLISLASLPLLQEMLKYRFEYRRWEESDYPKGEK